MKWLMLISLLSTTALAQDETTMPQVCVHKEDSLIEDQYQKLLDKADQYFIDHNCNKASELYGRLMQLCHEHDSIALARINFCDQEAQEYYMILSHAD